MSVASAERQIILASASPRRLQLLAQSGFAPTVHPADLCETWPDLENPAEAVMALALKKARYVASMQRPLPVLAPDTAVVLNGTVYGKPKSRADAHRILSELSGHRHQVYTGVALIFRRSELSDWSAADVQFKGLSVKLIEKYLDAADYMDKAGAYGVQDEGLNLIASYSGRKDTIMGLPLNVVERLWHQMQERCDELR